MIMALMEERWAAYCVEICSGIHVNPTIEGVVPKSVHKVR